MLKAKFDLMPESAPSLRSHILVSNHEMRPLAAGALYWEAEDTLLVADLHLEKGAAFAALIKQGWTDAIRTLHPEAPMYTFWDYKRNRWPRDAGLRLDHLLLSPQLAPRLKKAGVDRKVRGEEGASDHAPAWIVLS